MSKLSEQGINNFYKGYNCAQSVVLTFKDILNLDEDTLLKLASGFGGGIGRLREVCGAFSGAIMVISLVKGYYELNDDLKDEHYKRVQQLGKRFKEINKSLYCRDLLELDHESDDYHASRRNDEYYNKRACCVKAIESAVLLTEEELKDKWQE